MLERLLALVRQGGVQTPDTLARQLGVSTRLVELMLADLEQRGYIQQAETCSDGCSGCDVAQGCGEHSEHSKPRLWRMRMS